MLVNTYRQSPNLPTLARRAGSLLLCAGIVAGGTGCWYDRFNIFLKAPPPAMDVMVLRGERLDPVDRPKEGTPGGELAGGHEFYRQSDWEKAEIVFHRLADNKKTPPSIAEEARYYEAECLRKQGRYPKAADTYARMLNDFPSGQFREVAAQHMFDIANFWLDDTRTEMKEKRELAEGKRYVVFPEWVHLEEEKPIFDEEGRALEKLEQVRYSDITGPLADRALFLAGSVKFYRQDYKEADHYYSQLVEMHPNSPFAKQALELAIMAKQLSPGGEMYDSRKVAEARRLVDTALRAYPEFARDKTEFLNRQLYSITMQQAAKDYEIAEFYKRTGHPGSAYFCYEVVRRRYPGTRYFDLATQRMHDLRDKVDKAKEEVPPIAGPSRDSAPVGLPVAPGDGAIPRQLPPHLK